MQAIVKILDQDIDIVCDAQDEKRLQDLAAALNARLAGFTGSPDAMRRLVFTALALMDETQTTSAALARARYEIERLTDLVVEAKLQAAGGTPDITARGGVSALQRVAEGAA